MDADVVIAGYGPVGQLAANLLGAFGLRTIVIERGDGLHRFPRAAAIDDEGMRILQGAGLADAVRAELLADVPVAFVTRGGREVRLVDPGTTRNGHPFVSLLHQPALEHVLDAGARSHPSVDVRFGADITGVRQDAARVEVTLAGGARVTAAHLLACDGARSAVRDRLGIAFGGSTFAEAWLVVDLAYRAPRDAAPVMRFLGDPRRPQVSVPMGERRQRWEFMALPGEDHAALAAPGRVRELLAPHVALDEAEVERAVVYTHHARTAERWRAGRVLLAGDAAHVMPPFAGQGMCAGLRDVHNLAWKLAAVHAGDAEEALLDSYEAERRPHVEAMMRLAVTMGAVLQTRRPRAAVLRDVVLRGLSGAPGLGRRARSGSLRPSSRYRAGAFGAGGGRLFPQPLHDGRPLDDRLPAGGWALLGAGSDPVAALAPEARATFAGAAGLAVDPAWLGGDALVVLRPDRFVFAADRADGRAAAAAYRRVLTAGR